MIQPAVSSIKYLSSMCPLLNVDQLSDQPVAGFCDYFFYSSGIFCSYVVSITIRLWMKVFTVNSEFSVEKIFHPIYSVGKR